jgi:dTDP-4-amino-4,6-dideoxygalactose transaminase
VYQNKIRTDIMLTNFSILITGGTGSFGNAFVPLTLARYNPDRHALAVNSATSTLHLSCLTLGQSAGDWLWTPPITFVASANCGTKVGFIDIDPHTYKSLFASARAKFNEISGYS